MDKECFARAEFVRRNWSKFSGLGAVYDYVAGDDYNSLPASQKEFVAGIVSLIPRPQEQA